MAESDIVKSGYIKRLKNQKKRFFVLRSASNSGVCRLEYYENEKKFKTHASPKRVILLSDCFSVAKKDGKHRFGFALFTKDEVFGLVAEDVDDLNAWIQAISELMKSSEQPCGPNYQSKWPVIIKARGLGTSKNLTGSMNLGLSTNSLCLIKNDTEIVAEFEFVNIRRCGHTDCFFFMEVGRSACTGPGELWMYTEDPLIAQNMHEGILAAMKTPSLILSGPLMRSQTLAVTDVNKRSPRVRPRPVSAVIIDGTDSRQRTESLNNHPLKTTAQTQSKAENEESPSTKRSSLMSKLLGPGVWKKDGSRTPSPRLSRPKSMFIPSTRTPPLALRSLSKGDVSEPSSPKCPTSQESPFRDSPITNANYVDFVPSNKPVSRLSSSSGSEGQLLDRTQEETDDSVFESVSSPKDGGYIDMHSVKSSVKLTRPLSQLSASLKSTEGYIAMHPQDSLSVSFTPGDNFMKLAPTYLKRSPKQSIDSSVSSTPASSEEYVNMTFNESPKQEVAYVNMQPGSYENVLDNFEYMKMNVPSKEDKEEPKYNNSQVYVNFQPGNQEKGGSSEEILNHQIKVSSPVVEREYVNLILNTSGSAKENVYDKSPPTSRQEYVNFEPNQRKHVEFLRSQSEYVNVDLSKERKTSSPCQKVRHKNGISEYENFSPVLDSKSHDRNSAPQLSSQSKPLNYVQLNFSRDSGNVTKSVQGRSSRSPLVIDTSNVNISSPETMSPSSPEIYATIDFTRSEGLANAVRDQR